MYNLENENIFLNSEINKLKTFPLLDISDLNNIANDGLKQSFVRLQNNFQLILKEKENILNTLREETITNEEQKNYIEMLKQTIENEILNKKLFNILNNQR